MTNLPAYEPYEITGARSSSNDCDWCDDGIDFEWHYHELYVSRDGAAVRTADDLVITFGEDVIDLLGFREDDGYRLLVEELRGRLPNGGWLADQDDSDALEDVVRDGESALSDAGLYASWCEGYVIERVIEIDTGEQWSVGVIRALGTDPATGNAAMIRELADAMRSYGHLPANDPHRSESVPGGALVDMCTLCGMSAGIFARGTRLRGSAIETHCPHEIRSAIAAIALEPNDGPVSELDLEMGTGEQ